MKLEDYLVNEKEFYKREIAKGKRRINKVRVVSVIIVFLFIVLGIVLILAKTPQKSTNTPNSTNTLPIPQTKELSIKNDEKTNAFSEMPICNMENVECMIIYYSLEYGIDYKIALSISKWETGNFTSNAYLTKNNVGGMMFWNGTRSELRTYESLQDGVIAFVKNLKTRYFDNGLNTLEKIQPVYCPIGAVNDPNGLNNYWLAGTTRIYESL